MQRSYKPRIPRRYRDSGGERTLLRGYEPEETIRPAAEHDGRYGERLTDLERMRLRRVLNACLSDERVGTYPNARHKVAALVGCTHTVITRALDGGGVKALNAHRIRHVVDQLYPRYFPDEPVQIPAHPPFDALPLVEQVRRQVTNPSPALLKWAEGLQEAIELERGGR